MFHVKHQKNTAPHFRCWTITWHRWLWCGVFCFGWYGEFLVCAYGGVETNVSRETLENGWMLKLGALVQCSGVQYSEGLQYSEVQCPEI